MHIAVVGAGRVGLCSAVVFAELGHRVACVEIDSTHLSLLEAGRPPFFEPGLDEALSDQLAAGRLVFTSDLSGVLNEADAVILCLPTSSSSRNGFDLSVLEETADAIGAALSRELTIIVKSTVPPRTCRALLARIHAALRVRGREDLEHLVSIAMVPEFLREGFAMADMRAPSRLVIGSDDPVCAQMIESLHAGVIAPRLFVGLESAELIKLGSNAVLASRVALTNELARLCSEIDADISEVMKGIGMDPRIGPSMFAAGTGFGGSCLPKDVSGLVFFARKLGVRTPLIDGVIQSNEEQRTWILARLFESFGDLRGRHFAVWGLASKSGGDHVNGSAAVRIVQELLIAGAEMCVFDPTALTAARRVLGDRVSYAPTAVDACEGADGVIILSAWPDLARLSFEAVARQLIRPIIFDACLALRPEEIERYGLEYMGLRAKN